MAEPSGRPGEACVEVNRLLELGAQDYLGKPLDLERLVSVLDAAGIDSDPAD